MKIFLNDIITDLPKDNMSIADLLEWKGIKSSGTAVAVNNRHIRKDLWSVNRLEQNDRVTIINGAFGG